MNMNRKTRIPRPQPVVPRTKNDNEKSKNTMVNPLAKAMEKKPRPPQPETWFDEKVESVSQKQQQETKTDHDKRKEQLFVQLKKTEEELNSMQDLLDHREKLIKEAEEEFNDSPSQKENEGGEAQTDGEVGSEGNEKVEKITKKTMKNMRERMQEMREKLHNMNRNTDSYLADIENTMQYLDSLESASGRLGPLSEETRRLFGDAEDEEIIAKIYQENNQPEGGEEEEGEEAPLTEREGQVNDRESPEGERVHVQSKGEKFFLTEKSATLNPAEIDVNVNDKADPDDD